MFHRSWLEIDTKAFASNLENIRHIVAPADVLAVLKADAYGLGATALAKTAISAGVARIGVATAAEALELVPLGFPLQTMSAVFPEELPDLVGAGIDIPLADLAMAKEIDAAAARAGRHARVHIKLDTGMGRLGLLPDDIAQIPSLRHDCPNIDFVGIFTHFPLSTEHEPDFCRRQISDVKDAIDFLGKSGIKLRWHHVANSDAICHLPEAAQPPFNLVRAGITMHGLCDMGETHPAWVRDVVSFRCRIVSVRTLPAGHSVGYSATYVTKRPTRIGTLAAGYADGLPLALSNSFHVLVGGVRCPIVGRISMDYTTIDLTDAPDAKQGDVATLFGADGDETISPNEWAAIKKTHPYDIICSVTPRVPRIHLF